MPTKEKAWCGGCIAGALCNFGIAALVLPEVKKAIESLTVKSQTVKRALFLTTKRHEEHTVRFFVWCFLHVASWLCCLIVVDLRVDNLPQVIDVATSVYLV